MAWHNQRLLVLATVVSSLALPALAQGTEPAGDVMRIDIIGSPPQPSGVEPAVTPTFETLYRFPGGTNSRFPHGGVVLDSAGNVYGTTKYPSRCIQGLVVCGIVYKLTPPHGSVKGWTFKILHEFAYINPPGRKDGIGPLGPLILKGTTLYGTTSAGANEFCGCGEVFSISTSGTNYKQLHIFTTGIPWNPVNGSTPNSGVLMIGTTLYGTTTAGGKFGAGVLYQLSASGGSFKVLHHFAARFNGGPQGELLLGKDGYIYGTQFGGGAYNEGTVFRIAKSGSGFQVIYNFKGVNQPGNSTDGAQPEGRLAQGSDSTIYGTTGFGGTPSGYGTAWSIKHVGSKWVYKQIRRFNSTDTTREDANLPHSGFVIGSTGILYGTGAGGGHYQSGAIYKLTPPTIAGGTWGYKTLHSFHGRDPNGETPYAVLTRANGYLYGANLSGGHITYGFGTPCPDGCGTVFRQKP